jgi:hypothetical protein
MSYATIQTALAGIVRKVNGYTTKNVSEGNTRALGRGVFKAVMLRRGTENESMRLAVTANGSYPVLDTWTVNLELFHPYRSNVETTRAYIDTEMQSIVDEIRKWPKLNGTAGVISVEVRPVGEPDEWEFGTGPRSRNWWRQIIQVQVTEVTVQTASE